MLMCTYPCIQPSDFWITEEATTSFRTQDHLKRGLFFIFFSSLSWWVFIFEVFIFFLLFQLLANHFWCIVARVTVTNYVIKQITRIWHSPCKPWKTPLNLQHRLQFLANGFGSELPMETRTAFGCSNLILELHIFGWTLFWKQRCSVQDFLASEKEEKRWD